MDRLFEDTTMAEADDFKHRRGKIITNMKRQMHEAYEACAAGDNGEIVQKKSTRKTQI